VDVELNEVDVEEVLVVVLIVVEVEVELILVDIEVDVLEVDNDVLALVDVLAVAVLILASRHSVRIYLKTHSTRSTGRVYTHLPPVDLRAVCFVRAI
jgi:hypothetical protein